VRPFAFFSRRLQKPRDLSAISLGSLESEVMEAIWRFGAMSVREMHARFAGRLAYTTLMTTLDRLYKKSLLDRKKQGRAFIYEARMGRDDFEGGLAAGLFDELLSRNAGQPVPLLSCFVDAVSERDRQLLDELDRMVQSKRRKLKRSE
jgi:predicted transcriptional regulator